MRYEWELIGNLEPKRNDRPPKTFDHFMFFLMNFRVEVGVLVVDHWPILSNFSRPNLCHYQRMYSSFDQGCPARRVNCAEKSFMKLSTDLLV
jgi:hypothetical protein